MSSPEPSQPQSSAGLGPAPAPSQIIERLRGRPPIDARFENKGEIARGGMGAILRVFDGDLRRQLAMKVMLESPQPATDASKSALGASQRRHARFLEEAQITGQLDHPGIVPVHEIGLDSEGRLFFTMKLVKGQDLREVFALVRDGKEGWTRTRALGVLLRVCEAMAFAHEKGVIHRDLKPANVMVGRFGEVYVMDWGLAKVLGRPDTHDVRIAEPGATQSLVRTERKDLSKVPDSPLATMDGDVVGTPCYMPPEQARGRLEDIGPHSDVYSLGSMLYELLSGEMPYVGRDESTSPYAVLGLLMQAPPRELAKITKGVPDELIAICEKAMARDVRERYPSMLGVAEDLRAFLEGRVVKAHQTGAIAEFRKWIARNKGFAGTVAAAIVVALALSGLLALQQERAKERLEVAKDDAEQARVLAEAKRKEAEEAQLKAEGLIALMSQVNAQLNAAKKDAEAKEELARQRSYKASIAAAAASWRFHDLTTARARLENAPSSLRGWEWSYLSARCSPSAAQLESFEHAGRGALPFGSGNVLIAVDGAEKVLVAATGAESSTGDGLAKLHLVDLEDGRALGELSLARGFVSALAANARGTRFATSGTAKRIHVFDLATRSFSASWDEPSTPSTALAFSPDGAQLALSNVEHALRIVDAASGALAREFVVPTTYFTTAAFTPDGRAVVAGAGDGRVYVFRTDREEPPRVLGDSGASIRHVALSRDGQSVLAAADLTPTLSTVPEPWSSTVRQWEFGSGRLVNIWHDHTAGATWCGFARGGSAVASTGGEGTIRVRELRRNEEIVLSTDTVRVASAAPLRNGQALVTVDGAGRVGVWDTVLGEHVTLNGHRFAIEQLEFLADGRRLVSRAVDGTARLWDPRTGEQLAVLTRLNLSIGTAMNLSRSMAVSPVDARVAFGFGDGRVRLHDADSLETLLETRADDEVTVVALAFDARAARIAAGKEDGRVSVLDSASGERRAELRGTEGPVAAVHWIDDDARLVVATRTGALSVWDVEKEERTAFVEQLGTRIQGLAQGADGELLVDLGGRCTLVEAATALERGGLKLEGSASQVHVLASGRRIASLSTRRGVVIHDVRGGEPLLEFRPVSPAVALAVSGDGRRVAAGLDSGVICVWSDEPVAELAAARRAMLRARELAIPYVEELLETRALTREAAEAAVLADESISESLRAAALRLCRLTRGEPLAMRSECLDTVRTSNAEHVDYKLALWRALVMQRADPADDRAAMLEGAARYRLDDFAGAEAALARAQTLRRSSRTQSEFHAFRALVLCRLGRLPEARAELASLQEMMKRQMEALKQSNNELTAEIRAWLATLENA